MAFKLINRVRMSAANGPGTGTITVNLPAVGFQSFTSGGLSDGDQTPYLLEDGSPIGSVWEIGRGTWHVNGTFTRDTVTASSLGGTTKINATVNVVVNAIFRAEDLAGIEALADLSDVTLTSVTSGQFLKWNGTAWVNSNLPTIALSALSDAVITSPADGDLLTYVSSANKWENKPAASRLSGRGTPTVVQYATVSQSSTGACSVTLGSTPTPGNLLVLMGNGGNAQIGSTYIQGFAPVGFDYENINEIEVTPDTFEASYALRAVRSGDGATWAVGTVGNSGMTMNAVLVEVAGADVSAMTDVMVARGQGQGTTFSTSALSLVGALQLLFIGGGNGTLSVANPSPCTYGPSSVNAGTIAFNHAVAAINGFDTTMTISSGVGAYPLLITVPGALS